MWAPRLVSLSGSEKKGWMHSEAIKPLLGPFKVYINTEPAEDYSSFSGRVTQIPLLGGTFSLILFNSKKDFGSGIGTLNKNNFFATRPGIYGFSFGSLDEAKVYIGEGKDLFQRLKQHHGKSGGMDKNTIGFALICINKKLLRGQDPFLSEGLRGTLETGIKWFFHCWRNHHIGHPFYYNIGHSLYSTGVNQIISHVTKAQTPRSDGHYIVSESDADLALEIMKEFHKIFTKPIHSVLDHMCVRKLGLEHKHLPTLPDILKSF